MASIEFPTRQRAAETCQNRTRIAVSVQWLKNLWQHRNHPTVKGIDPRLARDIGLSEVDLARAHLRLPSQTTHHPRG